MELLQILLQKFQPHFLVNFTFMVPLDGEIQRTGYKISPESSISNVTQYI